MNRFVDWVISRLFVINESFTMAVASSIGIFIGMLPLTGIRLPIIIVVSILFNINVIAIIVGLAITILFPFVNVIVFSFLQHIFNNETKLLNIHKLSLLHLMEWMNVSAFHPFKSAIAALLISLAAFPLLKLFYNWRKRSEEEQHHRKFVFYDHTGKRWNLIKRYISVIIVIFIVIVSIFCFSININPYLPNLILKDNTNKAQISSIPMELKNKFEEYLLNQEEKRDKALQIDFKKHRRVLTKLKTQKKKVFGFYVDWDENSLVSLKHNINHIDVVIPNWYVLKPDLTFKNNRTKAVDDIIKGSGTMNMPLINNFVNNEWNGKLIHKLLASKPLKDGFIDNLFSDVKTHNYSGVNIDFESIDSGDKKLMTEFIMELCEKFHANNLKVSMDVPASDDAFDYEALSNYCDYMIVMMYDEHYETGAPGPVASDAWFEKTLDKINIPDDKLVVSLGNYGYDWNITAGGPADPVTYGDVMDMVDTYNLKINWDDDSGNPYISYKDDNEEHEVWLLDGATFYNELKDSVEDGICGAALWRLGSEDPTIWSLLSDIDNVKKNVHELEKLKNAVPVHYSGEGEVLRVISEGSLGKRSLMLDTHGDNDIIDESYDKYPVPFEVQRFGKPKGKEVVLTFDDGPDPDYTPKILDILKKYNVKASFFIVGENGDVNPDIVKRIYNEGHELGNHTYTHPNVASISPERAKMEFNATQRLIQELTGHSVVMFRPPYVADAEPSTANELLPILRAQEAGYTMIGEMIDPSDWEQPPSDVIVKRVLADLPNGNIILLHDAGGNRINTVKALPVIIETLRKKGYTFVTIHDLLGKSRDALMPSVMSTDNPFVIYDRALFSIMFSWQLGIKILFYLAIVLGIIRFLFLIYYSFRQRRRTQENNYDKEYKPFVSVVIAAYNEEKVICKTINSILKSDYKNFEIIIVNDGSKDNTALAVEKEFGSNSTVKLINKANSGKSSSVNIGFKKAKGEIIVALDADTIIANNAISLLVRHFVDERIAAVSGNVKVGNVHNLLTLWQHVEYVTGFNLERRAFSELNCITVVPGAIGAWRAEAVKDAGYFNEDTLAEDTDITLTLLRKGYKIAFEEFAYAYTESPGDLKSLLKQRYRWAYGTLQCLWKHREELFSLEHKALGFIALPSMWLFQYVFLSLSPLADIYFVAGLFGKSPIKILVFYLVFLIVDYLASIYAFKAEKESTKPLILLFLQRLVYRQLMTFVVVRSIVSALSGITVGWNKLQRKGNVKLSE